MSRVLYGVPGNLVVRDEERTAECVTGEPGMLEEDAGLSLDASWTVFRLNDRWRIAVSGGTAYAYRRRGPGAWEKYEIPR